MNPADSVPHLLECISRLPHNDQDLLLDLVNLIAVASPDVQAQARHKLSEVLAQDLRSHLACVTDVRDIVDYLERSIESQDPDWVPPLWRESMLPMPD